MEVNSAASFFLNYSELVMQQSFHNHQQGNTYAVSSKCHKLINKWKVGFQEINSESFSADGLCKSVQSLMTSKNVI